MAEILSLDRPQTEFDPLAARPVSAPPHAGIPWPAQHLPDIRDQAVSLAIHLGLSLTSTPHDALCRDVYSDPKRMASLLRQTLSPETLSYLDLGTLKLHPGTWIDPSLAETRSDLLFEVQGQDGCAIFLYVLFEHKSHPERFVALDLLGYMLDFWGHFRKVSPERQFLPAVLPLVLYHGRDAWTAPGDLGDLLDLSAAARAHLAPTLPTFAYALRDLSRYTDDQLRAQALDAFDRLTQLLLLHGRDDDLLERMQGWRKDLAQVASQNGLRAIRVFLSYLGIVQGQRPSEPLRRLLVAALGPVGEEEYMSWQEQLIAQGRAEGEAGGEARGQRALFMTLLRQRFGEPSAAVALAVEEASTEALTAWAERFFRASSPEELLGL